MHLCMRSQRQKLCFCLLSIVPALLTLLHHYISFTLPSPGRMPTCMASLCLPEMAKNANNTRSAAPWCEEESAQQALPHTARTCSTCSRTAHADHHRHVRIWSDLFLKSAPAGMPGDGDYTELERVLRGSGVDTTALAYVRTLKRNNLTGAREWIVCGSARLGIRLGCPAGVVAQLRSQSCWLR